MRMTKLETRKCRIRGETSRGYYRHLLFANLFSGVVVDEKAQFERSLSRFQLVKQRSNDHFFFQMHTSHLLSLPIRHQDTYYENAL